MIKYSILAAVAVLLLLTCESTTPPPAVDHANRSVSAELARLYEEDQADRRSGDIDWSVVGERDEQRRTRIQQLLDSGLVRTGQDHYHAAMIFQHGGDTASYAAAIRLMERAIELDTSVNPWLLAAATDRYLMRQEKPQIYGTQFTRSGEDAPWELYTIDTTAVTDAERRRLNVPPLAAARERERRMNQKKIGERYAAGATVPELIAFIDGNDPDRENYDLTEMGINGFGYQLIAGGKLDEARLILLHNTKRFPEAYNTHDSYGEVMMLLGDTATAIPAYQRSLALNPKNTGAKIMIKRMRTE